MLIALTFLSINKLYTIELYTIKYFLSTNFFACYFRCKSTNLKAADTKPSLLRSLSRNISTLATIRTIHNDIAMGDGADSLSEKTISQYLNALDRIFVTENLPAWNPALRSKTAIRTSPKRQFTDPSIATAIMRLTPECLLDDFCYFGFLFESLCDRDMRIYAEANDGQAFHYRDASDLEADAVICLNDGRWAAVEVPSFWCQPMPLTKDPGSQMAPILPLGNW
ncbi:MAG: DUF4143 domain-containing protein [Clostridiales bacterium]|nr:DUF4143 domain-containing protein [Clostridiales bacterium]